MTEDSPNDSPKVLAILIALSFVFIFVVVLINSAVTAYNGYQNYRAAQAYIESLGADGEEKEAQSGEQGQP